MNHSPVPMLTIKKLVHALELCSHNGNGLVKATHSSRSEVVR
jgi:hypothetical protein